MTDPANTAQAIASVADKFGKPVLASWMGGAEVSAGEALLNAARIPTYPFPDTAARTFQYMWQYSDHLRALYETPILIPGPEKSGARAAGAVIEAARKSRRTLLTEVESKAILSAYGIPTVETRVAHSVEEAVERALEIGFPVVLKLFSETVSHKTDVGGVVLDLRNASAVKHAWKEIAGSVEAKAGSGHFLGVTVEPMIRHSDGYELILGSSVDAQFGPVLLFGAGGQLVEVFRDRALGLPPLNGTLARSMMAQTRIFQALQGVRGRKAVDLRVLEQHLVRFSQLVTELPWIREIDVNPFLVSPDRMLALDARIVLHPPVTKASQLPRPAIRPYPAQYIKPWKLKNGTEVILRPIRPEDEPAMVKFHETLSERSVYYRYFSPLKLGQRVAHERLVRICFNDYDREIALVAERSHPATGEKEILGVGRLSKLHGLNEAEFAIVISDQWQNLGLGTHLIELLVEIGRAEKLDRIVGHILSENRDMQQICRKAGFRLRHTPGASESEAELEL
jgi:acetyltransferase